MLGRAVSLDLSAMPRSICGWPSLHTTGVFPPYTVSLAQRLLGKVLGIKDIVVDGIFTDETTEEIVDFQKLVGLEPNGYLNADTWPSLLSLVTPLDLGYTGIEVEGLQELLNVNGQSIAVTGVYDEITAAAVLSFQQLVHTHNATSVVDEETWHLLITQCNTTVNNYYWFDAGWPQGNISKSTFQCLRQAGFEYTVIECFREKDNGTWWPECVDNVANARAAGFDVVDVYMYPERFADPTVQARTLLSQLKRNQVDFRAVMMDFEGTDWNNFTIESNQEFVLSLRSVFDNANIPITVYCGRQWNQYFGSNFTAFADVPLIYAHYDNIPSLYDYDFAPYGGWTHASGKQFFDGLSPEIVCNIPLDWDWSPTRFWTV